MHCHCEIVMPTTTEVETAVEKILAPFDENHGESDRAFSWDYYQIGGRFSGRKPSDVCPLAEAMDVNLFCVIFANDKRQAYEMFCHRLWNGVTFQDTTFKGTLAHALELLSEKLIHMEESWRSIHTPGPDWITVTVDCHY